MQILEQAVAQLEFLIQADCARGSLEAYAALTRAQTLLLDEIADLKTSKPLPAPVKLRLVSTK
jgi:hypothetical protein